MQRVAAKTMNKRCVNCFNAKKEYTNNNTVKLCLSLNMLLYTNIEQRLRNKS